MKEELKNFNEMSDSRELMEAKPNPIMPLFIYLLLLMLIIAIIWTYFGEIEEVVKANGSLEPNETVSTVRVQESSQVEDIYFSEGKEVKAGDILFTMNQSDQLLQKQNLEENVAKNKQKLKDLKTFKKSVDKGEDLFSSEAKQKSKAYERYNSYQASIDLLKKEYDGTVIEMKKSGEQQSLQNKSLGDQKNTIEKKVEMLERLKEGIEKGINPFNKEESPYYSRSVNIELTLNQLDKEVEEAKKIFNKMNDEKENSNLIENEEAKEDEDQTITPLESEKSNELVIQEQVDTARQAYEQAEYELQQFKNQQILQVDTEIEQEKNNLSSLSASISGGSDFSEFEDNQKENYKATLETYKSETLIQINNDLEVTEQQIEQLNQELSTLKKQMEYSAIKAPIDGIINVKSKISKGDFLQIGTDILTIVPNSNSSTYKVQLTVLNKDIANIKVGNKVKFSFHSLPYQEYGQLQGEITKIGTDSINDPETGMSYYVVEATLNNKKVFSYKGKEATLKVGMTTDAHITVDSKKILYFLLEKINLRD